MARRLSQTAGAARPWQRDRRTLWVCLALVLLLHAAALSWLRGLLQPPSLLAEVVTPLYTRTITPQAPAPVPAPVAAAPEASISNRPVALIHPARPAIKNKVAKAAAQPASAASAAEAAAEPAPQPPAPDTASAAVAEAGAPDAASQALTPASAPASAPAGAASAAEPAYLASWPADTRLTYTLGGNYRGELHGSAQVLWQHEGTRYQAVVQLDVGILLSSRFTSQGQITAQGLAPEVYEEQVRQRRRGVRIGEDTVRLDKGEQVPRPAEVQDAASQFVELGHRFATGQLAPTPGTSVRLWLARPGGVDEWVYDIVGEETLHLPRLGAVPTLHLRPRPLDKPRGPISAEIWIAPTLQYLPVRIRLTQGADTYVDLRVETIEQK